MKETLPNTSIKQEEYEKELNQDGVDMIVYRMIGDLAEKIFNTDIN